MGAEVMSYPALVSKVEPQVVHDEALNERFIFQLSELDVRWDSLSTDEIKIHELLVLLIQDFEQRTYKVRAASPMEVLDELIQANGLLNKDLVGIFATESIISEIRNGKRQLTVEHIRKLAERFNVSPAVFI